MNGKWWIMTGMASIKDRVFKNVWWCRCCSTGVVALVPPGAVKRCSLYACMCVCSNKLIFFFLSSTPQAGKSGWRVQTVVLLVEIDYRQKLSNGVLSCTPMVSTTLLLPQPYNVLSHIDVVK